LQTLIGKKLGMTQIFEESGAATPVSVIEAGPCSIVQVKTAEKDGYSAIQIGFGDIREKNTTKARLGHFKKAGVTPVRLLREVRVDDSSQFKVGESLDVKVFEGIDKVHVSGTTKGRGFAGGVKRHNFTIGPKTHGSHNIREPGSVGMCATPARIFKGKKLPGRMGGGQMTTRNLKVVEIDIENNLLYIKGAIPGANSGFVYIKKA